MNGDEAAKAQADYAPQPDSGIDSVPIGHRDSAVLSDCDQDCADTSAESTNPKDIAGRAKCPMALIPGEFLHGVANVLGLGAAKYGKWNWTREPIQLSNYQAAALRHWAAIQSGEDIDQESGLSHWFHIAATAAIVENSRKCGTLIDDRPGK